MKQRKNPLVKHRSRQLKQLGLILLAVGCLLAGLLLGCNRNSGNSTGNTTDKTANGTVKDSVQGATTASASTKANSAVEVLAKPEVPILCYHRIASGKSGVYTVSPETFEAHLAALADSGYQSISPNQLYDYLVYNKALPRRPVLISFDDSRIEHRTIAAPLLEKYGFTGAFFIMTITYGKKNYLTTDEIGQLAKAGHAVGLHTWDHTMVTKYTDSIDWQTQLVKPRERLASITGFPVDYLAYPNGVTNHVACEQLNRLFKLSFTLISKRDTIYPLQTVRRMIAPECSPQRLLASMQKTFNLSH